jgi:DNA-binding HxlR family transcriptional regulator
MPKRFNEIKNELHFVTNHILSRELQLLLDEKLVLHYGEIYSLAPAGKALLVAVEPLYVWGFNYLSLTECSPEQNCSRCAHYEENVALRGKVAFVA